LRLTPATYHFYIPLHTALFLPPKLKTMFTAFHLPKLCPTNIIAIALWVVSGFFNTAGAQFTTPAPVPPTLSGNTINLTLQNGTQQFYPGYNTATIGYNGNHLGPTLVLQKGQEVTINVTNTLGDTTTTHWHGLHVAPVNDGGPHSHIMDGETWSPAFTVMDNAATYWYHPHLHGKTLKQVVKGAAGLIIVQDNTENAIALPRTYGSDDFPLVFQFLTFNNATKQIEMTDDADNAVLVNGVIQPYLDVPAQVVRLRLLNASSHRFFEFSFSDNRTFYQITSDCGLLNAPVSMNRLMLASGERAEILVSFAGQSGSTLYLKQLGTQLPAGYPGGPAGMGMGGMALGPLDNTDFNLLKMNVTGPTANAITNIPAELVQNTVWSSAGTFIRNITITASPMMSTTNFFLNGVKFDEEVINFTAIQGNTEIWNITNQSMMPHPFHIHGNHFYVLSVNGATPPANQQGRKDVITIPPMMGSVQLIIRYEDFADPDMPYMYHCHILSHEDNGMMGQFLVLPPATGTLPQNPANQNPAATLYPNPAAETLTLQLNPALLTFGKIEIFNTSGQPVLQQNITQTFTVLNIASLPSGLYFVKITGAGITSTLKAVVEK